jgi:hypothetical protein
MRKQRRCAKAGFRTGADRQFHGQSQGLGAGAPALYVLALVALDEQEDVRLVCNITHCDPDAVRFDMPVEVWFENHEDLWVPFFRPVEDEA